MLLKDIEARVDDPVVGVDLVSAFYEAADSIYER